jgi:hypothetical protein
MIPLSDEIRRSLDAGIRIVESNERLSWRNSTLSQEDIDPTSDFVASIGERNGTIPFVIALSPIVGFSLFIEQFEISGGDDRDEDSGMGLVRRRKRILVHRISRGGLSENAGRIVERKDARALIDLAIVLVDGTSRTVSVGSPAALALAMRKIVLKTRELGDGRIHDSEFLVCANPLEDEIVLDERDPRTPLARLAKPSFAIRTNKVNDVEQIIVRAKMGDFIRPFFRFDGSAHERVEAEHLLRETLRLRQGDEGLKRPAWDAIRKEIEKNDG